jgi:hypothetical protein
VNSQDLTDAEESESTLLEPQPRVVASSGLSLSVSVWASCVTQSEKCGNCPRRCQRIKAVLAGLMLAVTVTTVLTFAFVIGSIIAIIIGILFIGAVAAALVLAAFKRSARLRP